MTATHIAPCNFIGFSVSYWDKCCLFLMSSCSSYKYGLNSCLRCLDGIMVIKEMSGSYDCSHRQNYISTSTIKKTIVVPESKTKLLGLSAIRERYSPMQSILLQVYLLPSPSIPPQFYVSSTATDFSSSESWSQIGTRKVEVLKHLSAENRCLEVLACRCFTTTEPQKENVV